LVYSVLHLVSCDRCLNDIATYILTITLVRKFFIISVARELRLVFPTPSATAITIRNMHQAAGGGNSSTPRRKMKVLCFAFTFAIVHRVVSPYAPGILWVSHDSCLGPEFWLILNSRTGTLLPGIILSHSRMLPH